MTPIVVNGTETAVGRPIARWEGSRHYSAQTIPAQGRTIRKREESHYTKREELFGVASVRVCGWIEEARKADPRDRGEARTIVVCAIEKRLVS